MGIKDFSHEGSILTGEFEQRFIGSFYLNDHVVLVLGDLGEERVYVLFVIPDKIVHVGDFVGGNHADFQVDVGALVEGVDG